VKNYITLIKDALGPERAMIFMETVNALGLRPDDPELLLAAANASMVVSLAEVPRAIAAEREQLERVLARFLVDVDLKIAEAVTRATDEMETEVRTMARELAQGEYTAAASLRAAAINDEVRALKGATADLERARQATEAQAIATSTPEAASGVADRWRAPTPVGLVVLAVMLLVGVALGAALTKRTYAGWKPLTHRGGSAFMNRKHPPRRIAWAESDGRSDSAA
jgi:hypothetical protein